MKTSVSHFFLPVWKCWRDKAWAQSLPVRLSCHRKTATISISIGCTFVFRADRKPLFVALRNSVEGNYTLIQRFKAISSFIRPRKRCCQWALMHLHKRIFFLPPNCWKHYSHPNFRPGFQQLLFHLRWAFVVTACSTRGKIILRPFWNLFGRIRARKFVTRRVEVYPYCANSFGRLNFLDSPFGAVRIEMVSLSSTSNVYKRGFTFAFRFTYWPHSTP